MGRSSLFDWLLFLCLCLNYPFTSYAAPSATEMHAGIQLSETNFDDRVKKGLWFIEHFSPFCPHCKHFAPIWIELCEAAKPFESRGLYLAQIDCIAQGDLCVKIGVDFYPQMKLFENGVFVESYKGDRTVVGIKRYLDQKSTDYLANQTSSATSTSPNQAVPLPSIPTETTSEVPSPLPEQHVKPIDDEPLSKPMAEHLTTDSALLDHPLPSPSSATGSNISATISHRIDPDLSRPSPNQDGKMIVLTQESWATYTSPDTKTGPIFIKFYAPWCGHCQRLAPSWLDLAQLLRNQVNVAEFNCDDPGNKPICQKEGIPGYPTLMFYQDGVKVQYPGPRSLTHMEAFAKKAAATGGAADISLDALGQMIREEDVFFLFLYTDSTPKEHVSAVQTAAKSFLGRAIIFKSNAVELFARFGVPLFTPSILVFKDFGDQPWATYPLEPTATVSNVPSAGATPSASDGRGRNLGMVPRLTKWIDSNSLALMPELSAENYQAVFKPQDRKLVVLACIAGQKPLNSLMLKDELKSWAKQWRKSQQARDVKVPVDWVWTNATQWAGWLSDTYGVVVSPDVDDTRLASRIIVVDPLRNEYYDTQANLVKIMWNPTSVFQTLLAIELGKVDPKPFGSLIGRSIWRVRKSSAQMIGAIRTHWMASGVLLTALSLLLYRLLFKSRGPFQFLRFGRGSGLHHHHHATERNLTPGGGHGKNGFSQILGLKPSPKAD